MTPIFVTGTDTGVGKTTVALALMRALIERGLRVAGMKPVASGCERTQEGLRNDDALALWRQANVRSRYEDVNPYAFAPPIAPHIAAAEAGVKIELATLERAHARLALVADVVVVEGAGGWLTPLDGSTTLADFAAAIDARVVLVVGLRLGCLNHALLTARAIEAMGLKCAGWVGNPIDPAFERPEENLRTLEARLGAPRLATFAHASDPAARARKLALEGLPAGELR